MATTTTTGAGVDAEGSQRYPHDLHSHDDDDDDDDDDVDDGVVVDLEEGQGGGQAERDKLVGVGRGCCHGAGEDLMRRMLRPSGRSRWMVREWNGAFLVASTAGLFIDPLFFYSLSISESSMCLFLDGWFAVTVTSLRCMADAFHVWNVWLQIKTARQAKRRHVDDGGDGGDGGGRGVPYLRSRKGFLFDLFVILPVPQVVLWVVAPALMRRGCTTTVMTVFLMAFLFQYFPKVYHYTCLLRRMHNISAKISGTTWWGLALNLVAYFVASHAAGGCWFLLGIQRAAECLRQQCTATRGCESGALSCSHPVYYGTRSIFTDGARSAWSNNAVAKKTCLDSGGNFGYGAFKWTVVLVTNTSRVEKMLLPIFWGLMTLSTFGNIESTTDWLEVIFNIVVLTSGLILVTMLIGNIKVFLYATTSKKQALHLRMRGVDWWTKRRNLPRAVRQRVRQFERQRWAAMRGVDECDMTRNLPEGLRRDIKYHLCLDLVRQVPLFQHMDALVLENICDRVKSLIFPKGEIITVEGDPVQRMVFVVRGHLQSSQVLRDGVKSCCMLGPGNFSGDELLSWCLRRPFVERLPPSSSTLVTLETTEAFGLSAADLKYVTQHFRYTFVSERVKRSARYYSPGWRTWAAVAIQLAWRRYRHRLTLSSLSFIRPRRPLSRCSSLGEDKLRLYTALLTSPKPNAQDDFPM